MSYSTKSFPERKTTSTVIEISTQTPSTMRTPVILTMDKEYMNAVIGDQGEMKVGSTITDYKTGKNYCIREISFMVAQKRNFYQGQAYTVDSFQGDFHHDDLPSVWIRVIVDPIL